MNEGVRGPCSTLTQVASQKPRERARMAVAHLLRATLALNPAEVDVGGRALWSCRCLEGGLVP